jgi:hypothetical protein
MPGKDKAQADGRRRIEYVPLGAVERADRNAKAHDIAWIKSLVGRFGFVGAAVHDGRTGKIVAGHGRLESLQEMAAEGQSPPDGIVAGDGGTWAMPVEFGWSSRSDAEAEALAVALNEATTRGGWDERALAEILRDLDTADADLRRLAGWDDEGFAAFAESLGSDLGGDGPGEGSTDPDDVPEPPAEAESITRPGDIWCLGRHRLLCGDATDVGDVRHLMDGARADVMVTDPPYGVAWQSAAKNAIQGDLSQAVIPISFAVAVDHALAPDGRLYLFGGSTNYVMYAKLFDYHLHREVHPIVWVKEHFVMRPNNYHSQFEMVYFGWKGKGGSPEHWYGDRTGSDVWQVRRDVDPLHPTQKPVEACEIPIRNSCPPGGLVYEPFSGSGTTLIAAERLGRYCYAMELEPRYGDVTCRRWQACTGELPVLASTGEPHDFTAVSADPNPENRAA